MDGCGSPVDAVKTDEEIDIEVSKVEADVNQVETNEEVNEDFLLLFGYMFQKCLGSDATEGKGEVTPILRQRALASS